MLTKVQKNSQFAKQIGMFFSIFFFCIQLPFLLFAKLQFWQAFNDIHSLATEIYHAEKEVKYILRFLVLATPVVRICWKYRFYL